MCNTYVIRPKRGAQGLAQRVSEATARLASALVRKSDPGVAVRADGRVHLMRWGFHREFNPSINNARSDKLEGGVSRDAFHECRCVIPMTLFYEWGPGVGGRKQAHEFHNPDDDYLWAVGIWEEHSELGPCYSMVTTAESSLMSPNRALGFPTLHRAAGSHAVRESAGEAKTEGGFRFATRIVLAEAAIFIALPDGANLQPLAPQDWKQFGS